MTADLPQAFIAALSHRLGMPVWGAYDDVNKVIIVALEEPGPMCNPIFAEEPKDMMAEPFLSYLESLLAMSAKHNRYVTVH